MPRDQSDLFEMQEIKERKAPLAERLRPKTLGELKGQDKLISADSLLSQMMIRNDYHSFILWGPAGCG
jgi:putative ATPase